MQFFQMLQRDLTPQISVPTQAYTKDKDIYTIALGHEQM